MYRYTDPLTALENMLTQLENKYDEKHFVQPGPDGHGLRARYGTEESRK